MILTYKYLLYPTRVQEPLLQQLLDVGRWFYNKALEQRRNIYGEEKRSVSYVEQSRYFLTIRKKSDWLSHLGATATQQILRRADKSFENFFRRVKTGTEAPGYPRFKGANRFHSVNFVQGDGAKFKEQDQRLYIRNVGDVKVKLHRPFPDDVKIKQICVKKSLRKWYAHVVIDCDIDIPPRPIDDTIGLDMGLHRLITGSGGEEWDNPRWFRTSQAKLRRAQRKLARRKKGSNRRKKAAFQVAKIHDKIKNQRRDFWHKVTADLVATYDVIVLEDLNLNFMLKNRRLSKSAMDAGLGIFQELLKQKAEEAAVQVLFVDPRYTSQECSGCGKIKKKSLSERWHRCSCGTSLDRDVNAAKNILARAGPSEQNVNHWVERAPRSSRLKP